VRLHHLVPALACGVLAWLSEATILRVLATRLGFDVSIARAIGVLVVLNLGIAVPLTFANLGTFEAAIVFALGLYGVPASNALAVATVHHAVQAACAIGLPALLAFAARFWGVTSSFRAGADDKARAIAYYDGLAGRYDRTAGRWPVNYFREREHRAVLMLARFDDPRAETVIDVGSGGGFFSLEAKRAGLHVSSVDLAPGMIQSLAGSVDESWVGDVETLVSPRTYDVVICSGVLDFVTQPERAFHNLAALVALGGRLVINAPFAGLAGWIYDLEKRAIGIGVNRYSVAWFEGHATKSGMTLRAILHPLPWNRVLLFERSRDAQERVSASDN
jgi:SAM-dependent methyltransferase